MELIVNGTRHEMDIEPEAPLVWVLRDAIGLKGTKFGCGLAQCGACSVMVEGKLVRACVTPVSAVEGQRITTIEAVRDEALGRRVVDAWIAAQVPQCGYCQSGQVLAAVALLAETPQPTDAEIDAAMGNLCRCGTYNAIRAAIHKAADGAPA